MFISFIMYIEGHAMWVPGTLIYMFVDCYNYDIILIICLTSFYNCQLPFWNIVEIPYEMKMEIVNVDIIKSLEFVETFKWKATFQLHVDSHFLLQILLLHLVSCICILNVIILIYNCGCINLFQFN